MSAIVRMTRRQLLGCGLVLGGGLVLGLRLPSPGKAGAESAPGAPFVPNAFLRIAPDGTVTVILNKSEMGQGVSTSLPMLVAEELSCDWSSVRVEAAPVDPAYNHTAFGTQVTGGSTSVRSEWARLSAAGAAARTMLVAAAAKRWGVPAAECRAEGGRVRKGDGASFSYGELASAAAKEAVPQDVKPKGRGERRLLGRPVRRLDTPAKVDGSAGFGIDARVPGMLVAVVARPPVFGGRAARFDAARALAVPGVRKVFPVPSGVAVVATGFHAASKGREALDITWDEGEGAGISTASLRERYFELAKKPGAVARVEGDPAAAIAGAAKRVEAVFDVPFLAHATMEPLNCFVDLKEGSCEIVTGTQAQTWDRDAAARIASLPPEKVRLRTAALGGGFGRRANPASDFVSEAVHVAVGAKAPVKVVWTREDDMRGGFYRPAWHDRIAAGLDGEGRPVAWLHTIVGQSILGGTPFQPDPAPDWIDDTSVEGAKDLPYAVPNLRVDLHTTRLPVPVLWWRSVGHSHTAFVVESFVDDLARAAGKDPLDYRLSLLAGHPRHKGVLELAARKAGWGTALPKGRGRGIAVHESFGSFIAQVAEVSVGARGEAVVHRVVCAVDCGEVVNPSTIEAQMESAIVFGLSAALHGAITFDKGRVVQGNFDDYPILRMEETPEISVHIVDSTEAPGGVGEPGVPPVAPAVANALRDAAGIRLRTLPMTAEAIRAAVGKG